MAPTPEARAREHIDAMLAAAGWMVQSRDNLNLHAGPGVAVREVPTLTGLAGYMLCVGPRAGNGQGDHFRLGHQRTSCLRRLGICRRRREQALLYLAPLRALLFCSDHVRKFETQPHAR